MFGIVKFAVGGLVAVYLLAVAAMFFAQRQLQYFPSHLGTTPTEAGLPQIQTVDLIAADGGKSLLWYGAAAAGKPTILFFHGNAGEVADRADRLRAYLAQGYGVAFLSYRGFGASHAPITEAGLIADATAGYHWLLAQGIAPAHLIVVGESLGTGVAVQLAATQPVAAVALGAPYSSTLDVAQGRFGWLPVRLLMHDQFRSDLYIPRISVPILIQHGDADRVIPYRYGQRLAGLAGANATLVTLQGRGHEALFTPAFWAREMAFFAALPKS